MFLITLVKCTDLKSLIVSILSTDVGFRDGKDTKF